MTIWDNHPLNKCMLQACSWSASIILTILNWKVIYNKQQCLTKYNNTVLPAISKENLKNHKNIVCVSVHTSIWDAMFLLLLSLREKIPMVGAAKYELFWGPFGYFFRYMGMMPIYWNKKDQNTTQQIINTMRNTEEPRFYCVFPEGSRWKDRWRTSFWVVATELKCPILSVGVDFEKKIICPYTIIWPSKDKEQDVEVIKEQLYPFVPKYPDCTDLITRKNDNKKLIVTKSGNLLVVSKVF